MVDWQLVAKLIYDAVLVAVCLIAIRCGGFDERVGIGIVMGASGATSLALPIGLLIGVHSRYIVVAINLACLAALDALMVRSRSFWPMWATGAQLAGVSVDAAMLLMPVEAGPYVAIRGKFAYGVLLPLLIGALSKRKQTGPRATTSGGIQYGVEPPRITLPVIAADLERLAKVLSRAASEMRKPRGVQELDGIVELAERHLKLRRRRAELFDGDLFGEPVWDILLDLFIARAQDRQLSVTAVAYGSGVPVSTALRWISLLEKRGLIVRTSSERDRRRAHLEIAPHAVEAMEQLLNLELRTA